MSFFKNLYLKNVYGVGPNQEVKGHTSFLPTVINVPSLFIVETAYDLFKMGIHEDGPNKGFYVNRFLASVGLEPGNPWCMAFIFYCIKNSQGGIKNVQGFNDLVTGSTQLAYLQAKERKLTVDTPDVGDVMIFQNIENYFKGHAGIVIEIGMDHVLTIEGNYADKVAMVHRSTKNPPKNQRIRGYIRYSKLLTEGK